MPNCKAFGFRRGLEEQLRNGHFHNEAAESSQDFLNVPALLTKNQLLGKLPRAFLREQPVEDRQISVGFPQSSDRLPLKHDRWVVFPMSVVRIDFHNVPENRLPDDRHRRLGSKFRFLPQSGCPCLRTK